MAVPAEEVVIRVARGVECSDLVVYRVWFARKSSRRPLLLDQKLSPSGKSGMYHRASEYQNEVLSTTWFAGLARSSTGIIFWRMKQTHSNFEDISRKGRTYGTKDWVADCKRKAFGEREGL
jgi:hypothetical protein